MNNTIKQKMTKQTILSTNEDKPLAPLDEINLTSDKKITLRCGKSSITLYPNGKVVIKGDYIFSDAEGTNRIAGGRVELN